MRRRTAIAQLGLTFAALLLVATACSGPFESRLSVRYIIPDGYAGFLVTHWECPDGLRLPQSTLGGRQDATVPFSQDGVACIADSTPSAGMRVAGYWYESGDVAPVIAGGVNDKRPAGSPENVVVNGSIGIGDGRILGDTCSWSQFLRDRFGVPEQPMLRGCEPIFASPPGPTESSTPSPGAAS